MPNVVINHFPAVEIANKQYSLDADIITGWRPKNRILGPIPFNFDAALLDEIVDELTSFGSKYKERVIYLGKRVATQATGSPTASRCTRNSTGATLSSMKAPSTPTTSTWRLTSASFTPTSSPKTAASSRAWTPPSSKTLNSSLIAILKAEISTLSSRWQTTSMIFSSELTQTQEDTCNGLTSQWRTAARARCASILSTSKRPKPYISEYCIINQGNEALHIQPLSQADQRHRLGAKWRQCQVLQT